MQMLQQLRASHGGSLSGLTLEEIVTRITETVEDSPAVNTAAPSNGLAQVSVTAVR
jgi:hypothetical protein